MIRGICCCEEAENAADPIFYTQKWKRCHKTKKYAFKVERNRDFY